MKINFKKGFTLIESLVYIAIFAVVFTVIVQFSLNLRENNQVAGLRKELGDLIITVDSSMNESFSESGSIDEVGSVFNNDNGVISLNLIDGSNVKYSLNSGKIQIERNGVVNYLTTADFNCTKLYAEQILDPDLAGVRLTVKCTSIKRPQVQSEFTTNYLL